jgi:hypothetical protein
MNFVLATSETIITVSSIIGICGILAVLFLIIYNHSTNDKKHLKEGDEPVMQASCLQIHAGSIQAMQMLSTSVRDSEQRAAKAVDDLKEDMNRQFIQVLTSIRCLQEKLIAQKANNG